MPPEGPWELQGIELLSQNELYRQILLLLHLLPQDLLLLQVSLPHLVVEGVQGSCLPSSSP